MKIIDCFIFYNELDLLNYRLTILNNYVDYFILVESSHTFTGLPKKLFYNENKELYKEFNAKIVHIIVEDFPFKVPNIDIGKNQQWINEFYQRNSMQRGIDIIKNKLNNDDIILSSDVDEIPNPKILEEFKNNTLNLYISKEPTLVVYFEENIFKPNNSPLKFNTLELHQLELDMYYCNLRSRRKYWHGLKLLTYLAHKTLNLSFQQMRDMYNISPIIKNAGWHLSYFGDIDFIINKFKSFSDKEYNNEYYMNKERLQSNINNHINILNFEKLDIIPIECNKNLPPQYEVYLKKYI